VRARRCPTIHAYISHLWCQVTIAPKDRPSSIACTKNIYLLSLFNIATRKKQVGLGNSKVQNPPANINLYRGEFHDFLV